MSLKLAISYLFLMTMGWVGAHRFYLGRFWSGMLYVFTGGLCGVGIFLDFFLLPFMVDSGPAVACASGESQDALDFTAKFFATMSIVMMWLLIVGVFAVALG
jgi:hypothetical protein